MPFSTRTAISKRKMSLTQTYYLAHTARGKLSKEAARADHDLRLLVGHANLLDGLMLDLADAERHAEETAWVASAPAKRVTFAPAPIVEEDADDEDDMAVDTTDAALTVAPLAAAVAADDHDEEVDEDEDDAALQLTRTPSRSSPPELLHESDSESEDDDATPPSPPVPELPLPQRKEKHPSLDDAAFYDHGYYLPRRDVVY